MEKLAKTLKNLLTIIVILGIVAVCVYVVAKFQNIRTSVYEFFGYGPTQIYSFDGADINYNGGLTKNEIQAQKQDDNCPTHDDFCDTIYIQDYGDIVCMYKKAQQNGQTIYPNILFVKTDSGLKFEGALNIHAEEYAGWFGIGASYTVVQQYDKVPEYNSNTVFYFDNPSDNFVNSVGFSGFISRTIDLMANRGNRIKKAHEYVIKEIYPHFLTFCNGEVEIIQDTLTAEGDFNYFYTYIYNTAKSYDYGYNSSVIGGSMSVDISELSVSPLPSELKGRYVIPNTSPTQYFGVYNCKVFLTCNYVLKDNVNLNNDYVKNGIKDDPIEDKNIQVKPLCNISVSLSPLGEYSNTVIKDIIEESPVSITFYNNNGKYRVVRFTKELFASSKASINTGFERGSYTYEIDSAQLLFDSHSGVVNISNSSEIVFSYSYQNGKLIATFGISPVSSDVEYGDIDLNAYPVRIILNNIDTSETTQFVFDSQSKIQEVQSCLMKIGRYTYTILSEKLIFGSTSGSIEINSRNKIFDFSFAVIYNRSDLDFSVVVSETAYSSSGRFAISGDTSSVQLLGSKLNLQNYYINITLFDNNGRIVDTLIHTHGGSGGCSDSWTLSSLTPSTRYTAQMTYANSSDTSSDGYVEYQSSTFSFEYKSNTKYTFTYSCREVN